MELSSAFSLSKQLWRLIQFLRRLFRLARLRLCHPKGLGRTATLRLVGVHAIPDLLRRSVPGLEDNSTRFRVCIISASLFPIILFMASKLLSPKCVSQHPGVVTRSSARQSNHHDKRSGLIGASNMRQLKSETDRAIAFPDTLCMHPNTHSRQAAEHQDLNVPSDVVLPGDLVSLSAQPEYNGSIAVVTKVFRVHCTVIVLDDSKRFGIGECWPNLTSLDVVHHRLRVGSRVVLDGLQGRTNQRLNGSAGTIDEHPREGHPSFIRKPNYPDRPILTVCVRFDEPCSPGRSTMMVEPRFLVPYYSYVQNLVHNLPNEKLGA